MPPPLLRLPILPRLRRLDRLRQWRLVLTLAREAGINHVGRQAALTALGSLLDIAGLGVGVTLLLQGPPLPGLLLPAGLGLEQGLLLLVGLMLVRGGAQALVAIQQERLRSDFTDRLRQQLLGLVVHASGHQLEQLGRGELMGLLMSDISRSVLALDQAIRSLQAGIMLLLYGVGVLVVGRQSALPLLLALLATGMAALLQRSGSWRLGRLQSQLNGALQRTVGDGLHGLKAVRAATAEAWLLGRFADNTASFRQLLRENVRRQSLFQALRDALVVLVMGAWLVWGRAGLPAAAIATTLLLAYRSATALSAVVQAQRLCLGALPGYEELCQLRRQLQAPPGGKADAWPAAQLERLSDPQAWQALHWQAGAGTAGPASTIQLCKGQLVAVVGPSGSGKTTLLDRLCGLLAEEQSRWELSTSLGHLTLQGPQGAVQLRQLLAYAPQEAVLFEASLADNLLLDHRQPREHLLAWLERLGLGHLPLRPGSLEAPLHLAMNHVSGGEMHRLGLVRAWLRNRPIEVLDEPTAFLDAESAERVRTILIERSRERLVLISTHDHALITQADQLVRLEVADRATAERQHHLDH